jgi:hypothetical protein
MNIKKQLEPKKFDEVEIKKSAGILDDHSIRKTTNVREINCTDKISIGINSHYTTNKLEIEGTGMVTRVINGNNYNSFISNSDTATHCGFMILAHQRGTAETPTPTMSGDKLGSITFSGYQVNATGNGCSICGYADEDWGTLGDTTDSPGRIVFLTVPNGGATPAERMRITSTGNVGIGTTAPSVKLEVAGTISGAAFFASNGASGSFTTVDLKTVTVENGIITSIV